MDPVTLNVLLSVGGAVAAIIAHRMGINVPGLPTPPVPAAPAPVAPVVVPAKPVEPVADKPLMDCVNWLLDAKVGKVKLDERDVETLKMLKPLVDAMTAAK